VGEKRKAQLLKHFKSIKAIRAASLEELGEIVPKNTAASVYNYFHKDEVV
jgi:excinuclease ABC subunit C